MIYYSRWYLAIFVVTIDNNYFNMGIFMLICRFYISRKNITLLSSMTIIRDVYRCLPRWESNFPARTSIRATSIIERAIFFEMRYYLVRERDTRRNN